MCSYPIKLKLCRIAKFIKQVMNMPLFLTFEHQSREIISSSMVCQNYMLQIVFYILVHHRLYFVWFLDTVALCD